jgi:hypothetical protein
VLQIIPNGSMHHVFRQTEAFGFTKLKERQQFFMSCRHSLKDQHFFKRAKLQDVLQRILASDQEAEKRRRLRDGVADYHSVGQLGWTVIRHDRRLLVKGDIHGDQ